MDLLNNGRGEWVGLAVAEGALISDVRTWGGYSLDIINGNPSLQVAIETDFVTTCDIQTNLPPVGVAPSEPETGPEHGYGEEEQDVLEHDPRQQLEMNWHSSFCGRE